MRKGRSFTEEMRAAVESFYFDLYCQRWGQPELAEVMSRVPSLIMWDDHDIFDGWGSYPREQQESPIFAGIYEQAREHFRLFQLQVDSEEPLSATLPGQGGFLEADFKNQWLSRTHQEERLRLVHRLLTFSHENRCRVSIVSCDVHVAALGYMQSARNGFAHKEENVVNQLISSGIVHPPPLGMVVYAMEKVMGEVVEEVDRGTTARMTQFSSSNHHFLPARNWFSVKLDEQHRVWAKCYVEGKLEPYIKVIHPIGTPTPR